MVPSVPVQGIRVFETLLEMIFFLVCMRVGLFFFLACSMFDSEAVRHMFLQRASFGTDFAGHVGSHCC